MQTSRFQLSLIATLAVGLGFSLSSSQAVGYPAGAAVSLGANPLWSHGGMSNASSAVIFTAPADKDMVLTDLSLSTGYGYGARTGLKVGDGIVGEWVVYGKPGDAYTANPVALSMTSGIRIPAGQSLSLTTIGVDTSYAMSGYYAHQ